LSFYLPPSPVFSSSHTDPATSVIYTLSLHDALPICRDHHILALLPGRQPVGAEHLVLVEQVGHLLGQLEIAQVGIAAVQESRQGDRKSTRLNSSHVKISYAVFCLKKKKRTGSRRHGA